MIEAALTAALVSDAAVSALIGNRAFPIGGRQGAAYPYVAYIRVSTQGTASLTEPSGLDYPRFQVDSWGQTAAQALAVGEAVRALLGFGDVTAAGLTFSGSFQDQRGPDKDEETGNWRVSQDYYLFHERT